MKTFKQIEEEQPNDSDEDSFDFTEAFINPPFYDWKLAQKEFGLAYTIISEDGFDSFVKEKFLLDFIQMRKSYIMRDYAGIRFWAHKFKGSFKLFYSVFISKPCESFIIQIDKGMTFEIENLYCNFVVRMEIFIQKLADFSKSTGNPIKSESLEKLKENSIFCDNLEDIVAYNKIIVNRKLYSEGKLKIIDEEDEEIKLVDAPPTTLCSGCLIF